MFEPKATSTKILTLLIRSAGQTKKLSKPKKKKNEENNQKNRKCSTYFCVLYKITKGSIDIFIPFPLQSTYGANGRLVLNIFSSNGGNCISIFIYADYYYPMYTFQWDNKNIFVKTLYEYRISDRGERTKRRMKKKKTSNKDYFYHHSSVRCICENKERMGKCQILTKNSNANKNEDKM